MEYYMHGLLVSQFLWPHHYEILKCFGQVIQSKKSSVRDYLEVGGGHGLYIREAIDVIGSTANYQMVDISEISLRISQELVATSNVEFTCSDIFDFSPAKKYDFIAMGEVLEHVEEPVKLLRRLHGLLAENGYLFITTPTNAPAIDHIYLFRNAEEIRDVIRQADFHVVEERCIWSEDLPQEMLERLKISMMYVGVLRKTPH
jgi:2-polyprenyl-3-methyl-5-hydroxy-6-metoxy-1,4-benzoquinol methylase